VGGLENIRGLKKIIIKVLWVSILKATQLRGVILSLKHLVVKKK
jgi:hypothetical protein